jgi:hypothetical protein
MDILVGSSLETIQYERRASGRTQFAAFRETDLRVQLGLTALEPVVPLLVERTLEGVLSPLLGYEKP